jgi:hypothetical protein
MVTVCPHGHFWLPWIPAFAGMTVSRSQLVPMLAPMGLPWEFDEKNADQAIGN